MMLRLQANIPNESHEVGFLTLYQLEIPGIRKTVSGGERGGGEGRVVVKCIALTGRDGVGI
jgi:hypothetical protein